MSATPEELALIDAFIDKELDGAEAARAARLLEERADLRAYAEQQQQLKARLDAAFSPIADAEVPSRLLDTVRRSPMPVSGGAPPRTPISAAWRLLPIAAAVVLSLGLGLYFGRSSALSPIGVGRDGTPVAQGSLAKALTAQLAADTGSIAIGLSFQNTDGRMCRTFATQAYAGIACREATVWLITDLTQSLSLGDPTKFQTAGAPLPQQLRDRVKGMIQGDVYDAAAERAARDRGWRAP